MQNNNTKEISRVIKVKLIKFQTLDTNISLLLDVENLTQFYFN